VSRLASVQTSTASCVARTLCAAIAAHAPHSTMSSYRSHLASSVLPPCGQVRRLRQLLKRIEGAKLWLDPEAAAKAAAAAAEERARREAAAAAAAEALLNVSTGPGSLLEVLALSPPGN